jgi:predicted N-acetyltransferase YhbS
MSPPAFPGIMSQLAPRVHPRHNALQPNGNQGRVMDFTADWANRADEIVALFTQTFTASEGAEEGRLIGALARDLLATTPAEKLRVFLALDAPKVIGAIMFTPLVFRDDPRRVTLLAPVAVATDRQGQGVGQALIAHGLDRLRAEGMDVAVTYGDPAFYGRVGFRPITEDTAKAPFPLSLPHGWLAKALDGRPLAPLKGPSRCAPALSDPSFW